MASSSGWKGQRGRNVKLEKGQVQPIGSQGRERGGGHEGGAARNDFVPQRPPTVGQELPNNLDWQTDDSSRIRPGARNSSSSKKGNLDKNRDKKVEIVGSAGGRALDGSLLAEDLLLFGTGRWSSSQPPSVPPSLVSSSPFLMTDHTKKKKPSQRGLTLSDDAESRSERDDDAHQASNHGARPKKNSLRNGGAICLHPNIQMQSEQDTQGRISEHDDPKGFSTNQVVAKLFQIRDYIKQVTSTITSLQNSSDPATLNKMEKLYQIRTELIEHERRLVDLFQRVVLLQGDPIQMDILNSDFASLAAVRAGSLANVDGKSEESAGEIEDAVAAEEAESIARSNELLKQVAESQEKIKALQEQKSVMLNLQHQAESRLAQAKSFHGNLIVKTGNGEVRPLTAEEVGVSQALQDDLENIEQRLSMLQTMYSNKDWSESSSRSVDGEVCRVMDKSVAEAQRRELQDKLLHLQHKKQQMDDLLNELCILRERRWQGDHQTTSENADVKPDADDKQQQHMLKHTAITKETIAASTQHASVDTTDKIRKLDEMKSWLHTLQDMVYSHQPGKSTPNIQSISNHSGDRETEIAAVDLLTSPSENLRSKLKKPKKPKTDNISRQQSNECIANLSANYIQQPFREQPRRVDEASDDGNDSDFQEKVWRLHEAKNKLEKLQGLLNAVQQVQQTNQSDLVEEMFNTIDNDHMAVNMVPINESMSAISPSCRDQSKLKRLPAIQSNSESKGSRIKEQSPASVASRTSHSGQLHIQSQEDRIEQRPRQKSNVSSCDSSVDVSKLQTSNHDLMLEMRHQIALREELRQRHRELENLMQKDAGKNYLLNQDNHSENMSASAKSEFYMLNASTVATDVTTAATWGGSSVDNGVRDTMDGNDSQEEPNERCGDDEEYSSDEGVEVDNSILTTTSRLDATSPKPRNVVIHPDPGSVWGLPEPRRTSTDFVELHSSRIQNNASSSNMARNDQQQQAAHIRLKSVPVTSIGSDRHEHQGERMGGANGDNHQPPPPGFFPFQPGTARLQQQLDAANLFYQTVLGDQHRVAELPETYPVPPSNILPMLPPLNVADVFQAQHSQMVQQQLLLGLSHCYHVLYLQQLEMQQLQQTLQNSASTNTSCASEPRSTQLHNANAGETRESGDHANVGALSSSRWHPDNPSMARMTTLSSSSSPHVPHPPFQLLNQSTLASQHQSEPPPPSSFLHPDMHSTPTSNTETLNNQVPPGNRANNYWDNFRSYSRQNLLSSSVSHPNKSNDCFRGQCLTFPRVSAPSSRNMPSLGQDSTDRQRASVSLEVPLFAESAAVSNDYFSHHGSGENNRLVNPGHRLSQDLPKHKINKELSGLAVGQNVLKNCGNMSPNNGSVSTNQPLSTQSSLSGVSSKVPLKLEWNNANAGEKESEPSGAPKHNVEDAVYSEIVSLISHFNSDAQHLVQLLREMHKLNDGNAINRALRALRDVSASDVPQSDVAIVQNQASNAMPVISRSRPVYTDSSSSTDDNQRSHYVKTRRGASRYPIGRRSSYDLSSTHMDSRVKRLQSPDGFPSVSAAFLSPEHGRMLSASELKLGGVSPHHQPSSSSGFILQGVVSPNSLRQENSASEAASSSAHERESETSTDAPCSRFNIQQLDKQMQGIMMSLSSFVASFSRLTCNSKLVSAISSHIMALVLPLIHNLNQDAQNFPPGQFACILDNILAKYIGRRFADCEESLLSELSEVLFNELAFVQLMQNMDGNGVQLRSQKFHSLVEKFSTQTRNGIQSTNSSQVVKGIEEPVVVVRDMSPAPFQSAPVKSGGSRAEATDADLVVMARRGDEEIGDKMHEDFSCDIPDVCAGRGTISTVSSSISVADDVSALRVSLAHLESHPILSPAPLPEHGMLATAAEGQGEIRNYFDREVEIEEGIGDTQDLAEADQSQNYMEAESALDNVQTEEGFQVWCANGELLNGGIDRTEDDQQNEDELLGAVGFSNGDFGDAEKPGMEVGLDEVPIKLRDGSNSGGVHPKEESFQDPLLENNDSKSKEFGNPDNFGAKP